MADDTHGDTTGEPAPDAAARRPHCPGRQSPRQRFEPAEKGDDFALECSHFGLPLRPIGSLSMLLRPPACLLRSLGLELLTLGEVLQRILVDNPAGSRGFLR
jgi:hypothetical protein